MMKFYIQMGHGMEQMCRELSSLWNGATVILSPLNIIEKKLPVFAQSMRELNGKVLLDPQIYTPRKFHKNLQKYSYWPQTDITNIELGDYEEVLKSLNNINNLIQSESFILPSNTIGRVDDLWNKVQISISSQAKNIIKDKKLIHTIALKGDVLSDEVQIEKIIQYCNQWDVQGVYIVCEHPKSDYLVDIPIWITNLLMLVAGIKRQGKTVIVGYSNHQMLCLALAKCDAIASGNYLNVRWFKPDRFETIEDNEEKSRRAKWYYCPQAFSEYKIQYLDVAKRLDEDRNLNLLISMQPPERMANRYSQMLFEGAIPSSTNYGESNSHRHYLHCLKTQCEMAGRTSYEETKNAHLALLETALRLTTGLRNEGIKGQDRDFNEIVDVIEAAISIFDKEYGFSLSNEWKTL